MGLHPQVADREQALAFEPLVCHPGLCCQGSRKMPVSLAAEGGENGLTFARAEREEMANLGANAPPLLPVAHANAPPQPPIEFRHGSIVVRDSEVTHPSSQVLRELIESVGHRHAPATPRQATDAIAECVECVIGPAQLRTPERKPEELHRVGASKPGSCAR